MTLVVKFGGTSVGDAVAIERTIDLILRYKNQFGQTVAVASAMSGVTDLLLKGAQTAQGGDALTYGNVADELRDRHLAAIDELVESETVRQELKAQIEAYVARYESLCKAVLVLGELTPRALDTISAMGEQMSVRLVAAGLQARGQAAEAVDAFELVVTDDNFQAAAPLLAETAAKSEERLRPLLAEGTIPVVTGFIGATRAGVITTLGRGGSDYSAALLGQALEATEVWIWTDVDGVMSADPRLVPEARSLATLSYREIAELAFYGAKVLHPKSIRPVVENDIPLRIKNTFNPDHPGTVITPRSSHSNGDVKAVTAVRELSLVNVEGKGMMGVPGIAARTFGAVARLKTNVLLISQASSEQSICFAVPGRTAAHVVAGLQAEFAAELERRDVDRIWAQEPVAIVTAVGAGMRGTPGIAGRIFGALGRRGVNIIAIAQGSSECSISLVVEEADTAAAEKAIHSLILESVPAP